MRAKDGASDGRTDATDPKVKWQAVVLQERFCQAQYGMHLHHMRETMKFANLTWLGPATGLLRAPSALALPAESVIPPQWQQADKPSAPLTGHDRNGRGRLGKGRDRAALKRRKNKRRQKMMAEDGLQLER
jgi:hypothetical protein